MPAIDLPPFLTRYMDWIEANPALGVVSVLAVIVLLLWLLRKSLKFFMVVVLVGAGAIVVSYFIYGPEKTNNVVRNQTEQAIEQGKDLVKKGRKKAKEALEEQLPDPMESDE